MFTFHFLRAAGTAQQQNRCSIEIQVQIYRCNHTCQLGTITQKPYGVRFKFVFLWPLAACQVQFNDAADHIPECTSGSNS